MTYSIRAATLLPMFFLLLGCMTAGADGPSDKALSGDPDAMWSDGQKAVKRGEKLVKKGEERLGDGRNQVREGEEKVSGGRSVVKESRQRYMSAARAGGSSASPKEVATEAKRLQTIGSDWEDGIDRIKDGNSLVTKGNKKIDKGQTEIRKGRTAIEAGSTLMRNSQRIELGVELIPKSTDTAIIPDEEDGER